MVVRNFRYEDIPEWAEVKKVEIYKIPWGGTISIHTGYPRCAVVLYEGCVIVNDGVDHHMNSINHGTRCLLCKSGDITIHSKAFMANWVNQNEVVVWSGVWPDDIYHRCSAFYCAAVDHPCNYGDPLPEGTKINTNFDNHYHDFDEYFLIWRGSGVFWEEDYGFSTVKPGDLIITPRGKHHCVTWVDGSTNLVCSEFASRTQAPGRDYFLWNHNNGACMYPEPDSEVYPKSLSAMVNEANKGK